MSEQRQAASPLILEYIGIDDFACPMYKDQFGKLWKDIDLGSTATPSLYSVTGNDIDGEPLSPIKQEYIFSPAPFQRSPFEFEYMLLSRMQGDCEYYLGFGRRSSHAIGGKTVDEHISKMKSLWNGFPPDQKPEWLTWEQILDYEKAMRGDTK